MKSLFFVITATLIVLTILLLYFVTDIANGGVGSIPQNGEVINSQYNICIKTEANKGSGEWVQIISYHCNEEALTLDEVSSGECVNIYLDANDKRRVVIEQRMICKILGQDETDKKNLIYQVNNLGEFIEVQ